MDAYLWKIRSQRMNCNTASTQLSMVQIVKHMSQNVVFFRTNEAFNILFPEVFT